eukprot:COSAG05_NODE_6783_length_904_cov_0.931677_1_plen_228_part_00
MDAMMEELDADGSGTVDFAEFSHYWWATKDEAMKHRIAQTQIAASAVALDGEFDLRKAYEMMDVDHDGDVQTDELFAGLCRLGLAEKKDETAILAIIKELDEDKSGTFDYAELEHVVHRLLERRTTAAVVDGKHAYANISHIQLEHYRSLHCRIAKSLNSKFTLKDADESVTSDWKEDMERFGYCPIVVSLVSLCLPDDTPLPSQNTPGRCTRAVQSRFRVCDVPVD